MSDLPNLLVIRAVRRLAGTDPSPTLRAEAGRVLVDAATRIANDEIGRYLTRTDGTGRVPSLLADKEPLVRAKVARCLALNLSPKIQNLLAIRLKEEPDPFVQASVLQALAVTGGIPAIPFIAPRVSDLDSRVRYSAIEALTVIGDPQLLLHILPRLTDQDERVRGLVTRTVQAQDPDMVLWAVDTMMSEGDSPSQSAALFVLRYFDEPAAIGRLEPILKNGDQSLQGVARDSLLFLARKGFPEAARILARCGGAPEESVSDAPVDLAASPLRDSFEERLDGIFAEDRLAAILEVIQEGRRDRMGVLLHRLEQERDVRVVSALISAVGRLGTTDQLARLQPFLRTTEGRVRANTIEAIGFLGGGKVSLKALLGPSLKDPVPRAQANAAIALAQEAPHLSLQTLGRMLASRIVPAQRSAIWAAGAIGTPEAARILEKASQVLTNPVIQSLARETREAILTVVSEGSQLGAFETQEEPEFPPQGIPEAVSAQDRIEFDLGHALPGVRIATIKKLLQMDGVHFLPQFKEMLRDSDAAVRHAARVAVRTVFQNSGPGNAVDASRIESFRSALAAGGDGARMALDSAIDLTMDLGLGTIAGLLAEALDPETRSDQRPDRRPEQDPRIRAQILSLLALVGDSSHEPLIHGFIRDEDPRVRANALDALGLLSHDGVDQAAIDCLSDPDPRVRAAAITASVVKQREPFLTHLRNMLGSESVTERAAGLYAAKTVVVPERFELLRDHFINETQPHLYESAAEGLAVELTTGHAEEIASLLNDLPEGNKRQYLDACVRRLSESADTDEVRDSTFEGGAPLGIFHALDEILDLKKSGGLTAERVKQALRSETDPITITCLLEIAAQMNVPDAAELAEPFTHAKDRRVRLAAVEALGKIDTPEAGESIAFLVRDRDPEVSQRAVDQLGKMSAGKALAGIRSLLELGEAWALKRGLDLLEGREAAEGLELLLVVLERRCDPMLAEPAERLLNLWGDDEALERLSVLYRSADSRRRPLLLQLCTGLGRKLNISTDSMKERITRKPMSMQQLSDESSSFLMTGTFLKSETFKTLVSSLRIDTRLASDPESTGQGFDGGRAKPVVVVSSLVVLLGIVVWTGLSGDDPAARSRRERSPSRKESGTPTQFVFNEAKKSSTSFSFSSLSGNQRSAYVPTLQSIEENLRNALAPKGITSDALIHVFALDRFVIDHRLAIAQSRAAARRRDYDEAIRILTTALESTEEDHITARVALLKALTKTAREATKWDLLDLYRKQLAEVRKVVLDMIVKAAREGGLPRSQIEEVINQIENRKEKKKSNQKAVDYLSGRQTDPAS